jgi:exodeoxyribonuclease-3
MRLAYIITRTEPYAAKPLNINFSGFAGSKEYEMRLYSWNINGVRAAVKHGMLDWLKAASPDILCIQETKVSDPLDVLDEATLTPQGYQSFWNWPKGKKGYSGVALYAKKPPEKVETGFGLEAFDTEGRVLIAHYPNFVVLNVYFPNGKQGPERLEYKMGFYAAFLDLCKFLKKEKKNLIMCGDYNTAHTAIDLARPKENEKVSGFLPIERAWIDQYVANGYHDTLRLFHGEPGLYTWWDVKTRARERNVGWRIDYIYVCNDLKPKVKDAFIAADVAGSDHCPIGVEIDVEMSGS